MSWTGPSDAPPTARIAALAPSLQRSERRVVDALVEDLAGAVECTAQQLADRVGVGRASVIRTAQTLGYDGYPQLRVALARELALTGEAAGDDGVDGTLRAFLDRFSRTLPRVSAALTEESVAQLVTALDVADRVVVAASGLSVPLGYDAAMRLSAAGRPAEFVPDSLAQQIAARQLQPGSVCLVISGSGANPASLHVAAAAREAGAAVLALTSFTRAPLVELADIALVVPTVHESFSDELIQTSRVALTLVLEGLVELLVDRRGDRGRAARTAVLSVLGARITE